MRKNKKGRTPKTELSKMVYDLREGKENLSFTEIALRLNMDSRQLARYHYLRHLSSLK